MTTTMTTTTTTTTTTMTTTTMTTTTIMTTTTTIMTTTTDSPDPCDVYHNMGISSTWATCFGAAPLCLHSSGCAS